MMRLFVREPEACLLIDPLGWGQNALRSQNNFLVSSLAGELNAFLNERMAKT